MNQSEPTTKGKSLVARLDQIGRNQNNEIFSLDHKSSKYYSSTWEAQWKLNFQMSLYTHVLGCAFPDEKIYGMVVNGMIFYKKVQKGAPTKNRPVRVPIRKNDDLMNAWLYEANHLVKMLEWETEGLMKVKEGDPVLTAFPRRSTSCTRFNRLCPYSDFCTTWANPLQHCDEPPLGFKQEFWNPADEQTKPCKKRILL